MGAGRRAITFRCSRYANVVRRTQPGPESSAGSAEITRCKHRHLDSETRARFLTEAEMALLSDTLSAIRASASARSRIPDARGI